MYELELVKEWVEKSQPSLAYMACIRQNHSTYQDLWAIYANVNKHFGPFATQYFTNLTWTTTLSYVTFQIRMPRSPSNTSVVYLSISVTSVVDFGGAELIWCRFTKIHQSSPPLISLKRILSNNFFSQKKVVLDSPDVNPNWHEAGQIYPPYNFWIGFCQLIFYQKFPNIFGSENWDQSG